VPGAPFFFPETAPGEGTPAGRTGNQGAIVPKQKTHKASKKRFRVTATGLLKRMQAGKKHLLSHKTSKRKRKLGREIVDGGKLSRKYIAIMGGHA
jgi:large subunit ribosomal protein L35